MGDSFYPLLGNGGYDVLHYDIDLDVEPSENTVDAVTTITAVATENLDQFNLDFLGLEVSVVSVDGVGAGFSRDGQEMTIQPAEPVSSGDQFTVAVSYSGTPQPFDDPGVPFFTMGWNATDTVIYTVSQPSGAMTWYPSNNHPTDKAAFTFRITVPDGVTAAATGLLSDETSDDGSTTTTWQMDDPMATYLAAVYIGDFERHEQRLDDGLLIRDYVPRGSDAATLEQLALAPEAIIDPYVIAHEVAHQWIGNSMTVDDWSHIWLHEGFAHYDQTAGSTTNTEIFLGIVSELAGPEAVWVVESWLHDPEMPSIVSGPTL